MMRVLLASFCVFFAAALPGFADQPAAKPLEVGDKAPVFEVLDDKGKPWKSSEHFGKKIVVIYFYPADMTGGCTAQACAFRDDMGHLADQEVEVVGVSGDSVTSHQLFKQAHQLNFTLLADVDGKVADAFGVPKVVGDRTVTTVIGDVTHELTRSVTAQRWTFIVARDGKIAYKDDHVNARQDSKRVLQALEKLK